MVYDPIDQNCLGFEVCDCDKPEIPAGNVEDVAVGSNEFVCLPKGAVKFLASAK